MKIQESFIVNNPCYKANVNKADSRYTTFQNRGPIGLVLHSVGCPQPTATVFAQRENSTSCQVAVHAFIDANNGTVVQTMPWNYRAWHCGADENNTHVGVEMCESNAIKYRGVSDKFDVVDKQKALAHAKVAYDAAVELFAYLCKKYNLNPLQKGVIKSHKEIGGHTDPEHYWTQIGASYTMDGFRADVNKKMGGTIVASTVTTSAATTTIITTVSGKFPKLSKGCEGESVKSLQQLLIAKGYSCGSSGADGDFGAGTETAVKKYQTAKKLTADGVVGAATWSSLLGM